MRVFGFIVCLFFSVQVMAFSPNDLRAFGKESPVQFYLFTSLTCPHCSDFHKKILPTIKKEYVDTGKAQLIVVDMINGKEGLLTTQALRCLTGGDAERCENELYQKQSKWTNGDLSDVNRTVTRLAAKQGMTQQLFDLCTTDEELQKNIIEQQVNLARLYGITVTPTLVMRRGAEVYKWAGSDKNVIMKGLKEAFQQ